MVSNAPKKMVLAARGRWKDYQLYRIGADEPILSRTLAVKTGLRSCSSTGSESGRRWVPGLAPSDELLMLESKCCAAPPGSRCSEGSAGRAGARRSLATAHAAAGTWGNGELPVGRRGPQGSCSRDKPASISDREIQRPQ